MKSHLKITSTMVLIALVFSLLPALTLPTNASAATCDWVQFISDVTVPDGTKYEPGATFKKTWRLKNIGTCTWTTSYSLVFDSGAQMGAPASIKFPSEVKPGQTIDINVDMTAPNTAGHYIGYWKFKNASGVLFGIGSNANKSWWVEINVAGGTTTDVAYDFTANAASATWSGSAGGLTFPGTDGDAKGFALKKDAPKFESGVTATKAGLLFAPQNIINGSIQARYPAFKVQSGDRFQATVGCEFGATSCYVAYRLDYEADGAIKTFWTFRERYEGLTYGANLDLTPLAGKDVRFILYVSAYGSPTGDRALWGNPLIVRKGGVTPPPPTVTGTPPTATPSKTPPPITQTVPPSSCDKVQFIADVNFPDGTVVQPGAQFTKTWRLKNVGSCAWTTSYQLVFFSGEKMGAASSAAFTMNVPVGQTVDISMNMVAPTSPGTYRGYWMFKNASGALFGIGAQANKPWWVEIKVTGGPTATPVTPSATATQGGPTLTPSPTPTPLTGTAYDFAANACSASWFSGSGSAALPCPGTEGDAKGFVLKISNPKLENGTTDPRPGLITFPQNKQDGYIQGIYPAFSVQSGDRFQSVINCEFGATNCYVVFRLDYQTGSDPIKPFWGPFLERYEGGFYNVDVDLTPLAGKDVKFILTTLAVGSPVGDRALWVGPRIYRPTSSSALPDLSISAMKIELQNTSCLETGASLGTRVWVTNGGQASAPSFALKVGDAQQTVNGLAVGETKDVFFSGYSNPVSAVIDPAGSVTESNEQNNTRSEMVPVPTAPLPCSPTATPNPTSGWESYLSENYGFTFKYPNGSPLSEQTDTHVRIALPIVTAGTNLSEKYVDMTVVEGANPCKSPDIGGMPATTETVTINGIQFLKESGGDAGAGNIYDYVAFSAAADGNCVSLSFVLHSLNPGNFPVPPPEFDKAVESAVFDLIIKTFDWTG